MSLKFGQKCQNSSLIKHKELVFNQAFEYCVFQLDLNGSVGGGPSTWFNISWLGLYTVLWSPRLGLGWRTLLVSPGLTIRVQHPSPNLGENGLCIAIYDIIFLTEVFYQNLYISACWYVEISVCTIFLLFHLSGLVCLVGRCLQHHWHCRPFPPVYTYFPTTSPRRVTFLPS